MKHELIIRLGLLAASLVLATDVSASDIRPWSEGNDYVQLDAVSASNQHPVSFNVEQLTTLLGQFYKHERNKEPAHYFSQDEISRIAPGLVRLFAKAKTGDDIEFGTSFGDSGLFLIPRKLNAGRLFVDNGQLNLLIGMCATEQDITYQQLYGKYRELEHGSRVKPGDKPGCELLVGYNMEHVNKRTDWLRLNINAALTTKAVPVSLPGAKSLTFGGTEAPDQTTTNTPVQLPATVTRSSEPAPLSTPAFPANETEGRLILLKQLHDKGLITDAEYDQKRATLLKEL